VVFPAAAEKRMILRWSEVPCGSGVMYVGEFMDYARDVFRMVVSPQNESWRWEVVRSPSGTGPAAGVVPTLAQAQQKADDWVEERRER
jgi:hypothetical protein